jgi:hypothetical protein
MSIIKRWVFFTMLAVGLWSSKCNREEDLGSYYGHWTHSFEEDRPEYMVYRPNHYDFPPSRGREGFKISSNGDFERFKIGSGDQIRVMKGFWKRKNSRVILVSYENDYPPYERFEILEVELNQLKIKKEK